MLIRIRAIYMNLTFERNIVQYLESSSRDDGGQKKNSTDNNNEET